MRSNENLFTSFSFSVRDTITYIINNSKNSNLDGVTKRVLGIPRIFLKIFMGTQKINVWVLN